MTRVAVLALALLALAAPAARAATKTAVTVTFSLRAYEVEFLPAEIAHVETRAAERIVARLREYAPFLDFTTAPGKEFTLAATLRPRATGERAGAPAEVIVQFKLGGPQVQARPEHVIFRPANDLSGVPLVDGFIEEIDLKLTEDVYRGQLRSMLLQVPIARTGQFSSNPAGWVLPHRRTELCLHFQSRLNVEHIVRLAPENVRRPQLPARADEDRQGQIFGRPVDPSNFQQEFATIQADQVSVAGIWITEYRDLVPCSSDFGR